MKEYNIMIKGASIHPKKGYVNKKLKEEGKVEEKVKLDIKICTNSEV